MSRRHTWSIDTLEPRELLSITPLINSPGWVSASSSTSGGSGSGSSSGGSTTGVSSALVQDPATGVVTNPSLGGNGVTSDVAPPRPGEALARQFTARFHGNVQTLPPRLFDQSHRYMIIAPGQSTAFLHGTVQLEYFTPDSRPITVTDPATGQTIVEQVTATTGTISMSDRSTQSGTVLLGNLVGSTQDEDSRGRPTHFTFTINGGGGSGGTFASSTGSGTVDISYKGNKAVVTVIASIFTSGVGNQLAILQSNSHR